jgi:hypothetical protein
MPPAGRARSLWGGIRMSAPGGWLPADTPVWLIFHGTVIHLVVTELREVHRHDENVSNAGDRLAAC